MFRKQSIFGYLLDQQEVFNQSLNACLSIILGPDHGLRADDIFYFIMVNSRNLLKHRYNELMSGLQL